MARSGRRRRRAIHAAEQFLRRQEVFRFELSDYRMKPFGFISPNKLARDASVLMEFKNGFEVVNCFKKCISYFKHVGEEDQQYKENITEGNYIVMMDTLFHICQIHRVPMTPHPWADALKNVDSIIEGSHWRKGTNVRRIFDPIDQSRGNLVGCDPLTGSVTYSRGSTASKKLGELVLIDFGVHQAAARLRHDLGNHRVEIGRNVAQTVGELRAFSDCAVCFRWIVLRIASPEAPLPFRVADEYLAILCQDLIANTVLTEDEISNKLPTCVFEIDENLGLTMMETGLTAEERMLIPVTHVHHLDEVCQDEEHSEPLKMLMSKRGVWLPHHVWIYNSAVGELDFEVVTKGTMLQVQPSTVRLRSGESAQVVILLQSMFPPKKVHENPLSFVYRKEGSSSDVEYFRHFQVLFEGL